VLRRTDAADAADAPEPADSADPDSDAFVDAPGPTTDAEAPEKPES
jgi:hypothetical protein